MFDVKSDNQPKGTQGQSIPIEEPLMTEHDQTAKMVKIFRISPTALRRHNSPPTTTIAYCNRFLMKCAKESRETMVRQ
jgi:hypothetical protein